MCCVYLFRTRIARIAWIFQPPPCFLGIFVIAMSRLFLSVLTAITLGENLGELCHYFFFLELHSLWETHRYMLSNSNFVWIVDFTVGFILVQTDSQFNFFALFEIKILNCSVSFAATQGVFQSGKEITTRLCTRVSNFTKFSAAEVGNFNSKFASWLSNSPRNWLLLT